MSVGAFSLDSPPQAYYARMHDTIELRHFLVGMSKAPIFAVVIGLIGCLERLQVEGTAQSVGERTTSSVVPTLSLGIINHALAAIWLWPMGCGRCSGDSYFGSWVPAMGKWLAALAARVFEC